MTWSVGPVVVTGDEQIEDKVRDHESVVAVLGTVDGDAKVALDGQLDAVISAAEDLRANLGEDGEAVTFTASGHVDTDGTGSWSATVTVAGASGSE